MRIILIAGFVTMLVGSFSALSEMRVKKMVAYSTLSQMGLSMMVYGLGYFHLGFMNLIAHGLAKRLLFIQVGYLIHLTYNQQNLRKWSFGGNFEGVLRVQLACTLFSLCGMSFFGGMVVKEAVLGSVSRVRWRFVLLTSVVLSVYLTFVYSYLIYRSLFIMSSAPLLQGMKSSFMLVGLVVEVLLVVGYLSWLCLNVVEVRVRYNYAEVVLPLGFLISFASLGTFIVNLRLIYDNVARVALVVGNHQHYT
jgi:NADH:ubiquinone oxidoreductase subunit 5 (subunit L)/multisubunit Na+/H+ antiporter MnhA subunit